MRDAGFIGLKARGIKKPCVIHRNERFDVVCFMYGAQRHFRICPKIPEGVIVLAVREDGRLVFVKQRRPGFEKLMFEPVAGGMDKGEKPAAAARREVAEETGYRVKSLRRILSGPLNPGTSMALAHLFVARVGNRPTLARSEPDLPDSGVAVLTLRQTLAAVERGDFSSPAAGFLIYRHVFGLMHKKARGVSLAL